MKYIGFIRRFDEKFPFAEEYYSYSQLELDSSIDRLLAYLESCPVIAAFMTYWFDEEGSPIDGALYYSDGIWCWPGYLSYYLKKNPKLILNPEFVEHVCKMNYSVPQLTESTMAQLSNSFLELLKVKDNQ